MSTKTTDYKKALSMTRQAQGLAIALYAKYSREGITYKRLNASNTAIKANENRQALTRELMDVLNQLERKYYALALAKDSAEFTKNIQKQWNDKRSVVFTLPWR